MSIDPDASVAVSHHFDPDLDPACHSDADPDPACHLDAVLDPTLFFDTDPILA